MPDKGYIRVMRSFYFRVVKTSMRCLTLLDKLKLLSDCSLKCLNPDESGRI